MNALKQIVERASKDQISKQIRVVSGSAAALPIQNAYFSRLSHSDVLCCLPEKLEMLRECRRVATTNALMHFSVILPALGLSPPEQQEVLELGPPFIDVPGGYETLLEESGWCIQERINVSPAFRQSLQSLVRGMQSNTPALQEAFGANELARQSRRRERQIEILERGLMQRVIYITSPHRPLEFNDDSDTPRTQRSC